MNPKAFRARLEILPFEVLERTLRLGYFVTGEMHLAIGSDNSAIALDEDRRVVTMAVVGELGVAEVEPDTEPPGLVEQRLRRRTRHLPLEELQLLGVGEIPSREERSERKFRKHHQLCAATRGVTKHHQQPLDHVPAQIGSCHRTHLGRRDRQQARHRAPARRSNTWRSTFAPASRSASSVSSAGLWLIPRTLGTKTIPAGHTCASICAS